MKLPRRLDRERRIHDLSVLLREKTEASTVWFRLYQKLSASLAVAKADRNAQAEEIAALKRQVASTQLRLSESRQENERLRAELHDARFGIEGVPS